MSNKFILKNGQGKFYVEGAGFSGSDQATATQLDADTATATVSCANRMGFLSVSQVPVYEAPKIIESFGVVYIRRNDTVTVASDGTVTISCVAPNGALNQRNPSRRRFATEQEANIHASNFYRRRARRGDAEGTAGHRGVIVVKTNDPVNAKVNPATGKTNPI